MNWLTWIALAVLLMPCAWAAWACLASINPPTPDEHEEGGI